MIELAVSWKRCKTNRGMSGEEAPHKEEGSDSTRRVIFQQCKRQSHDKDINGENGRCMYTCIYMYNVHHITVPIYKSDN